MLPGCIEDVVNEVDAQLRSVGIDLPFRVEYGRFVGMTSCVDDTIFIPTWQIVRVLPPFKHALVHTLLHECGHVFLWQHHARLQRAGFERVFGADEDYPSAMTLLYFKVCPDEGAFVSGYATAHPEEDWAETFAYVVERALRPPTFVNVALRRKVEFVLRVLTP